MIDPVNLDDLAGHIETIRQIKAKQDELAAVRAELEQAVKDRLGNAESGTISGQPVVCWKHGKRTALSQKILKDLHPLVYAECCETTVTRRFELS